MAENANQELETFRKQWQEEVSARSKGSLLNNKIARTSGTPKREAESTQPHQSTAPSTSAGPSQFEDGNFDGPDGDGYHDLEDKDIRRRLGEAGEGIHPSNDANREPNTALEHYEKAVERESQGNLGDSLKLYRKAYRMDAGVDRIYKNKHFPPSSSKSKPINPNPSNAPVTVPNPAHHSLDGPPKSTVPELIASFSTLTIPPAPLPTEQSPSPCPIATIPSELLVEILERTAVADVASFARLTLVCKRLAYLVTTEDQIWKRICHSSEYGFKGMHYNWACSISGSEIPPEDDLPPEDDPQEEPPNSAHPTSALTSLLLPLTQSIPLSIPLTPLYPSYKTMFRSRPRIRFNGCYISTVNYIRPGASTTSQVSWSTPVHIVTYYRYLRFFRDGTCVSLLTTTEPLDVVHHLRKENMHRDPHNTHHGVSSTLPSAVMKHALHGRWRLGARTDKQTPTAADSDKEADLTIETEGVDPDKYVYRMELALRSSGGRGSGGTRNNKLVWRGFWSWNRLTDDWAEFGLRNDRAFVWSRVASYGAGE